MRMQMLTAVQKTLMIDASATPKFPILLQRQKILEADEINNPYRLHQRPSFHAKPEPETKLQLPTQSAICNLTIPNNPNGRETDLRWPWERLPEADLALLDRPPPSPRAGTRNRYRWSNSAHGLASRRGNPEPREACGRSPACAVAEGATRRRSRGCGRGRGRRRRASRAKASTAPSGGRSGTRPCTPSFSCDFCLGLLLRFFLASGFSGVRACVRARAQNSWPENVSGRRRRFFSASASQSGTPRSSNPGAPAPAAKSTRTIIPFC